MNEILEKLKKLDELAGQRRRALDVQGFVKLMEDFFDDDLDDIIEELERLSKN
jgi:hypothetical protein